MALTLSLEASIVVLVQPQSAVQLAVVQPEQGVKAGIQDGTADRQAAAAEAGKCVAAFVQRHTHAVTMYNCVAQVHRMTTSRSELPFCSLAGSNRQVLLQQLQVTRHMADRTG